MCDITDNKNVMSQDSVHKPQPFRRKRRAEAVSNRGPSAYQPNALPLGQTGSRIYVTGNKNMIVYGVQYITGNKNMMVYSVQYVTLNRQQEHDSIRCTL